MVCLAVAPKFDVFFLIPVFLSDLAQFQNWVGNVTGSFLVGVFVLYFSFLGIARSREVEKGDIVSWTDHL